MLTLMILLKDNNGTRMHTDGLDGMGSLVGTFCVSTAEKCTPKKGLVGVWWNCFYHTVSSTSSLLLSLSSWICCLSQRCAFVRSNFTQPHNRSMRSHRLAFTSEHTPRVTEAIPSRIESDIVTSLLVDMVGIFCYSCLFFMHLKWTIICSRFFIHLKRRLKVQSGGSLSIIFAFTKQFYLPIAPAHCLVSFFAPHHGK